MFLYILRRISLLLITLLALTFVAYLLDYRLIGLQASFWSGYPDFLSNILDGDSGLSSVSGLPVLDEIRHYFPATLILCATAFAISLLVGIPLGTLAALSQGKPLDLHHDRRSHRLRGARVLAGTAGSDVLLAEYWLVPASGQSVCFMTCPPLPA